MQNATITTHITDWLQNYAETNHQNGFVIGISGGVDSALTSTLCAQTGLKVLCLDMPIHQKHDETGRSTSHIKWLKQNFPNVHSHRLDLTAGFDALVDSFPPAENESNRFLSLANTRARLRMTTLYYFAGLHELLVAGTGNKIEDFGIGFFTKYGDGAADINPIADLNKTEVLKLSGYLNIDNSILKAQPTDGLWEDNRSDEDQIGATYPALEWAMQQANAGKTQADFSGRNLEVFKIYQHRHKANQHKWQPIPFCEIPEAYR